MSTGPRTTVAFWQIRERDDAVVRLLVLSGLRRAEAVVKTEVEKMSVQIDIENNEYLKSIFVLGEARGESKLLIRQLRRRFGDLPSWVEARVPTSSTNQLEAR